MTSDPPLILTLALDEPSFAYFDEQRRRYFPPGRNFIPAHLTLFHKLAAGQEATIVADLEEAAARQTPIPMEVKGLRALGRGVAYALASTELARLRLALAKKWALWLTLQDRQKHQPHVTIQNKVEPRTANTLLSELTTGFRPFRVMGTGLDLWRYRGGPWEEVRHFPFV